MLAGRTEYLAPAAVKAAAHCGKFGVELKRAAGGAVRLP
jgi:hypothetical protein